MESGSYKKAVRRAEAVDSLLTKHPLADSPTLGPRLRNLVCKDALTAEIRLAQKQVRAATTLIFRDELKARRRVLRRLGLVSYILCISGSLTSALLV